MQLRPIQIAIAVFLSAGTSTFAQVVNNEVGQSNLRSNADQQIVEANQLNVDTSISYDTNVNSANEQRRRLFSWPAVFRFVIHPPHHPHHGGGGGGGGSSGGGSSSGGSSGGGSSGGGGGSSGGGSSGGGSVSAATSGGGGSSSGGSSSGGGWSWLSGGNRESANSASSSSSSGSDLGTGSRIMEFNSSAANITMFVIAAAAAGGAIAAIAMGRRQTAVKTPHALQGVLYKRINLFSNFAHASSTKVDRPERLVEMTTNAGDDRGYALA